MSTAGHAVAPHASPAETAPGHEPPPTARPHPLWRSVAMPTEHGGWGLSAEPGLLGLLVAPSWAGLALALAAVTAFLVRTPLKLALVDRRRGRSLPRTRLATRIAGVELALMAVLAGVAFLLAEPTWIVPLLAAVPLIATELWFDVRSRGRRLVPELCGAVGVSSVATAVALAGGAETGLAVALWLVLAARAVATIPFARTQVFRFRKGSWSTRESDLSQAVGGALAGLAVVVSRPVVLGALAVVLVAMGELWAVRRPPVRPRVLGFTQLGIGLAVVAATAVSTLMF